MRCALPLKPAVFLQFKPCRGHPLIFRGRIISLLAFSAGQHYQFSRHCTPGDLPFGSK